MMIAIDTKTIVGRYLQHFVVRDQKSGILFLDVEALCYAGSLN